MSRRTLSVLALVQLPNVLPLLLVDDGQDSGDGLSDTVAARGKMNQVSVAHSHTDRKPEEAGDVGGLRRVGYMMGDRQGGVY